MSVNDDSEGSVIRAARAVIARASWAWHVEAAAHRLDAVPGVATTAVFPPSHVVQAVAIDGTLVGTILLRNPGQKPARWFAAPLDASRRFGPFPGADGAIYALALRAVHASRL